jgi:DMSO reductase anchor subunit
MSLDKAHIEQMNKLDELIKTAKERKLTRFVELIVASIVGVVTSKLYDAIYSTPIVDWADGWTRAFIFVILLVVITAFLFLCANWTDILHDIRNRRKKPS